MGKIKTLLINGKLIQTTTPHPDEKIYDKSQFVDLFLRDVEGSELVGERSISPRSKNKIYQIKINGETFNFVFNGLDGGGRIDSLKVEIPFSSVEFMSIVDNSEPVFVINVYRELLNKETLGGNRVWFLVKPSEIYSSEVVRKHKSGHYERLGKKPSSSSRWFKPSEFRWIMEGKQEQLENLPSNSRGGNNVIALSKKRVGTFFTETAVVEEYKAMMKQVVEFDVLLSNNNEDFNKAILKMRGIFSKLLRKEGNNFIFSSVTDTSQLKASHIRSVWDIKVDNSLTKGEKLEQIVDTNNGILIPSFLDDVFDKYKLTFNDEWLPMFPEKFSPENLLDYITLEKYNKPWIKGKDNSRRYLSRHREITISKSGKIDYSKL